MIDLETMGTKPGCAIVSIGAVEFDRNTGKIGDKFYAGIKLSSCQRAGLTIDAHTVLWWLQQGQEARVKVVTGDCELASALLEFSNFMAKRPNITDLWGNSASFDLSILKAAYDASHMKLPWSVWSEKCYRTVTKLFPGNYLKKDEVKAHDPIYDCEYQISILCATLKSLNGKNYV